MNPRRRRSSVVLAMAGGLLLLGLVSRPRGHGLDAPGARPARTGSSPCADSLSSSSAELAGSAKRDGEPAGGGTVGTSSERPPSPGEWVVHGTAVRHGGSPVIGAEVMVCFCRGPRAVLTQATKTDETGAYRVVVPVADDWHEREVHATTKVIVRVHAANCREGVARLPSLSPDLAGSVEVPEVRLRAGTVVRGFVRAPNGEPVPDADVALVGSGEEVEALAVTRSDASGMFVFSLDPASHAAAITCRLIAGCGRHGYAEASPFRVGTGEVIDHADLVLHTPDALVVSGRVILACGAPLGNTTVELGDRVQGVGSLPSCYSLLIGAAGQPISRTSADGVFRVCLPAEGAYMLTVRTPGVQASATVMAGDNLELRARGEAVRLSVLSPTGALLPGARVRLYYWEATLGASIRDQFNARGGVWGICPLGARVAVSAGLDDRFVAHLPPRTVRLLEVWAPDCERTWRFVEEPRSGAALTDVSVVLDASVR